MDKEQRSDICDAIEVKKEDLIKDIKEKIKFSDESGDPIDLIMNFLRIKQFLIWKNLILWSLNIKNLAGINVKNLM